MRKVAYSGCPGAFGHEACLTFLPDHEPVAQADFAQVLSALQDGKAELGILPYVNSIAGPVEEVAHLLETKKVTIIGQHWLPIRLHLLGKPGASLGAIHSIVSHPMALAQCGISLGRLGRSIIAAVNTAGAARALAQGEDEGVAVLASEPAAKIYGLSILRRDMQDREDNRTQFLIVSAMEDSA